MNIFETKKGYFVSKFHSKIDYNPRKLLDFEEYRTFLAGILAKHLPFILNLEDIIGKQED